MIHAIVWLRSKIKQLWAETVVRKLALYRKLYDACLADSFCHQRFSLIHRQAKCMRHAEKSKIDDVVCQKLSRSKLARNLWWLLLRSLLVVLPVITVLFQSHLGCLGLTLLVCSHIAREMWRFTAIVGTRLIYTIIMLPLMNVYPINVKTYQFKTHCKDDVMISLH